MSPSTSRWSIGRGTQRVHSQLLRQICIRTSVMQYDDMHLRDLLLDGGISPRLVRRSAGGHHLFRGRFKSTGHAHCEPRPKPSMRRRTRGSLITAPHALLPHEHEGTL